MADNLGGHLLKKVCSATYQYDAYGDMTTMTASDGGVWKYAYDELGRMVSRSLPVGTRTWTMAYDAADHLVSSMDPDGNTTQYVYDSCLLAAVVNPLNERTSYTYGRFGNRLTETNPLGDVTQYAYDVQGRLTTVTDALNNTSLIVYQPDMNRKLWDVDALGNVTTFLYDGSNRLSTIVNARGYTTVYGYDARDMVSSTDALGNQTQFVYDALGRQTAVVSPMGFRSTTVYDAAGQVVSLVDAMNALTQFQYDLAGNRTTVTDANGEITSTVYYSNKNTPLASVDALGNRTTYNYDEIGWLRNLTDPKGGVLSMNYWGPGQLRWVKNQLDVANREYDYDAAGRVSVFRNAGLRETMTYDAVGRQTGRRFNSGERVTQMYDALGRRTTLSDFWGVATTTYDALGRVTHESNRGLATQYEYDQNGNRTLMVDPGGGRFTYQYDELDRLKSMQVPTGQRYTQQYDADSRRTTLLLGLGSKRRYEYDSVGRVTTQIEFNSSNQRIYTMVDSYDAVGNRTGRNTNGNPTTWLYDDAYRLIGQEKSGQRATFVYDDNSNLTTKWHQGGNPRTIAYDVADRITTYQEGSALTTLAWQSRGAMHTQKTGTDTTTFTYSDPMFLTAVDGPSGRLATYVYDSESKRRRIYEGAAFTTIVWDGWDYLQWRRPSGTHVFHTMNGEIVGESVGGAVRDYLLDPLGSVVATLDSGGIVDQFEYWPYGELVDDLPEGAPVFLWVGGLGYWFDTDERRYVRHRILRTDLGSWMQLDPLWPNQRPFCYCADQPVGTSDPSGRSPACLLKFAIEARNSCRLFDSLPGRACIASCLDQCYGSPLRDRFECLRQFCERGPRFDFSDPFKQCKVSRNDITCAYTEGGSGPSCTIYICPVSCYEWSGCGAFWTRFDVVWHEAAHCCQSPGDGSFVDREKKARCFGECMVRCVNR